MTAQRRSERVPRQCVSDDSSGEHFACDRRLGFSDGTAAPAWLGQSELTEDPSARFAFRLRLLVDGIAAHSDQPVNPLLKLGSD
jgi:hypothetical protein